MELREALEGVDDLVILYVMAEGQINDKTRRFVEETGLRERVRFLKDPGSRVISAYGLLRPDPEPMEAGVVLNPFAGFPTMVGSRMQFEISLRTA